MNETINDQYVIIQKIGEGGMGSVYLAEDILLQRRVAIKSLNKPKATTPDEMEGRFQQEALALARLNHPNITHVYTFVQQQQSFWMVMEYVEGKTLEAWIAQHGAIGATLACSIAVQILNGLEHAHHKGIIHRDLKPANIMISSDGEVKIMDFGIARIRNSQRLTQHGKSVGTLEYMAPEQIQGKEGDELTDVYATGNILYEMLSGVTPFKNDTDYHLMKAKLEEKVPLHPGMVNRTSHPLRQVILKSLERNPANRYTAARTFKDALLQHAGTRVLTGAALHEALQDNQDDALPGIPVKTTSRFMQHPVQLLSAMPGSVAAFITAKTKAAKAGGLKRWWAAGGTDRSIQLLIGVVIVCMGLLTWNYVRNNDITVQNEAPPAPKTEYNVNLNDSLTQQVSGGIIEQQLVENRAVYNGSSVPQAEEGKKDSIPSENLKAKKNSKKEKAEEKKDKPAESNGAGETKPAESGKTAEETTREKQPSYRSPVTVPRGINVRLVLQDALNSEDKSKDGSLVRLTAVEDVKVNGQVIIEQGAVATGKIVDVVPSSKRRGGLIGFIIMKVKARDGSEVRLASERFRLKAANDNEAAVFGAGKMFAAEIHKGAVIK